MIPTEANGWKSVAGIWLLIELLFAEKDTMAIELDPVAKAKRPDGIVPVNPHPSKMRVNPTELPVYPPRMVERMDPRGKRLLRRVKEVTTEGILIGNEPRILHSDSEMEVNEGKIVQTWLQTMLEEASKPVVEEGGDNVAGTTVPGANVGPLAGAGVEDVTGVVEEGSPDVKMQVIRMREVVEDGKSRKETRMRFAAKIV